MKKLLLISLFVLVISYISIPNYNNTIKLNTIYSKAIVQQQTPTPSDLSVDDSLLRDLSKNILSDVLAKDLPFSEYNITTELTYYNSSSQNIMVNFLKDNRTDYTVFFDLNAGELTSIINSVTLSKAITPPILSREELESIAFEYLERLPINSTSDYSLVFNEFNSLYYYIYFENIFLNKSISLSINPDNGELISFVLLDITH